ncbi:MAG: undecaprenyl-diphosphate phosphatase [Calditerrivibrio sp.]|nr:undecaprenyl-diphosphate phosphatase [Calditerrivibrio sp.]MCA1932883.1 undecaprenyl-diphosphate phosphatase [Calditerrivibrio sp.]MCA1979941.1 undecaprenyl-diphosphate phosphatase [Calditerrivibrio sp.]
MGFFEAILLGLLQGLTEFLPVSSSGHLVIAQSMIKDFKEPGLLFDTILHLATFCAVIIYFREKISLLLKAFFGLFLYKYRITYYDNKRFLWAIFYASIPTAIIGLTIEKFSDTIFSSTVYAGYGLIITSVLLVISDNFNGNKAIDSVKGFWVGVMQGISVMPGISRSGSTIALSVILGIKREEAVEFSFLMSLPAVFGAVLLQSRHITSISEEAILHYIVAAFVAFITAFFAIHFMIKFIKKASLKYFAIYCLIVGIITVVWL